MCGSPYGRAQVHLTPVMMIQPLAKACGQVLSAAAAPGSTYLRDQGLCMPNALVYVTISSIHKVSQETRDAGQPEARAKNFQFAWYHLTLLRKFSSLHHRASHCNRKEKRKTRPTVLQVPQGEGISCPALAYSLKEMDEERQNSRWNLVLETG